MSDDTSHRDEMRVSPRSTGRPAMAHARTAGPKVPSPKTKTPRQEASTPPSAADLLAMAHRTLQSASGLNDPLQQYALTHRAALHAAAAVVTARQRPEHRLGRRARVRGSWDLLPEVAPEFAKYGVYFEKTTVKMIRAEAGIAGAVDIHELTELRGITAEFVRKVEALDEVKTTGTQTGNGDGAATMRRTS
ncbi:SAV_6107 family HEPN domain-containing protein [Streptomyces sp. A5-4]|uniref:SAV_6107 family HEPN domain-containing protein n=1 Tax=Streptomyces sp. A5-4 TaxID=3384771 RepID=UPI003DA915C6